MDSDRTYRLLIGGKFVSAISEQYSFLIDPVTAKQWARVSVGGVEDINKAVKSAELAQTEWRKVNSRDRTSILLKLANLIRGDAESLAQLESRNTGKPIREARDEVALAANCFEYYAGAIDKVGGQTIPVAAAGISLTLREPVGICGLITPWNFPIVITAWKVAPALAMGNTKDISRVRIARAIETGVLSINTGHSVHLEAPFGGVKHSGLGYELGLAALEHYSKLKSIFIADE